MGHLPERPVLAALSKQFPAGTLAVIVLYKSHPADSVAFQTLQAAMARLAPEQRGIRVLLYDNTPAEGASSSLPEYVTYHAAPRNHGIAAAYNYALSLAKKEGLAWLLVLDQDTSLPSNFLARMIQLAESHPSDDVSAIVPQLFHGDTLLSPFRILPWGVGYLPRGLTGVPQGEIGALNSASMFRVSDLDTLGGFHPRFWLDYQDYYIFHQLHRLGKKVCVAGDIRIEHDLSLLSDTQSPERYCNFLQAETAFCDLYRNRFAGFALTVRLAARFWQQRRQRADAVTARLTLHALKRRILLSAKQRILDWQQEMDANLLPSADADIQRPPVSVCMATYNGARFLHQQVDSILAQLRPGDELVVVDDASTDNTWPLLKQRTDPRLRLFRHEKNQGVIASFEQAISHAAGDYIFLSDQDDVWRDNKVDAVLAAFERDPSVTLIVTNTLRIDENGTPLATNAHATKAPKLGILQTLIKNSYQGSLMAFRKQILPAILPFPAKLPMHDSWIGMVNSAVGKTFYLHEALSYYRRHGATVTRDKHASVLKMVLDRWQLLLAFSARYPHLRRIRRK